LLLVAPPDRRFQKLGFLSCSDDGDAWSSFAGDFAGDLSTPLVGLCGRAGRIEVRRKRPVPRCESARFGELLCAGDAPCRLRSPLSLLVKDAEERLLSVRTGDADTSARRLLEELELGASGARRSVGDGRVGDWDGDERGSWRWAAGRLCELEREGKAEDETDASPVALRDGPGSSQSSSKLSGLSRGRGKPLSRELLANVSPLGAGGRLGLTGSENSKSSSQFSVTTLRRTGGVGVAGTTVAVSVPPDDMGGDGCGEEMVDAAWWG
jgi:hypothetical protein